MVHIGDTTNKNWNQIVLGLGMYLFPFNSLSKSNPTILPEIIKPCGLKVRRYEEHMIKCNEYLAVFLGSNTNNNICETELNGIILHCVLKGFLSMLSWSFFFEMVPF